MKKATKIMIIIAIVIAICGIAGTIWYLSGRTEREFTKQIELANDFLDDEDYDNAIAAFSAAIEIDPQNPEAYLGLAEIYEEQGDAILAKLDGLTSNDEEYRNTYVDVYDETISYYNQALDVLVNGYNVCGTDSLGDAVEDIEKKIADCESERDSAAKNIAKEIEEEKEKEFRERLASYEIISEIRYWAEEDLEGADTSYLSTEEAKEGYGPLVKELLDYVNLLMEDYEYEFTDMYFQTNNLSDAKAEKAEWYGIGRRYIDGFPDFWNACHYLVLCYQAEHDLPKVLEIKKTASDMMKDDYFLEGWIYTHTTGSDTVTDTYDQYDLRIKFEYADEFSGYGTNEYDENGNKTKLTQYIRQDVEALRADGVTDDLEEEYVLVKELIYDDTGKIVEFNMYLDDQLSQKTTYDHGEYLFDAKQVFEDLYDGNGILQFTLYREIDVYGNIVYEYIEPAGGW